MKEINHSCTIAKMAEQLGIELWQAMEMDKFFTLRLSKRICENCRWWFVKHGFKNFGICQKISHFYYYDMLNFRDKANDDIDRVLCITTIQDIFVGKNFGCIHWEEK